VRAQLSLDGKLELEAIAYEPTRALEISHGRSRSEDRASTAAHGTSLRCHSIRGPRELSRSDRQGRYKMKGEHAKGRQQGEPP
jgi:hypothetical protein